MVKSNLDIRQMIQEAGTPYWVVADRLGVSENTFSRWLRKELPDEKKESVKKAIDEAKKELQEVR